jgi:hypothetical protein
MAHESASAVSPVELRARVPTRSHSKAYTPSSTPPRPQHDKRLLVIPMRGSRRLRWRPNRCCCGRHAGVCRLPLRPRRLLLVWRSSSNGTLAHRKPGARGGCEPAVRERIRRPNPHGPSPVSVRKPPRFRGNSWKASPIAYSSETCILQDLLGTLGIPRSACHAEGRGFRVPSGSAHAVAASHSRQHVGVERDRRARTLRRRRPCDGRRWAAGWGRAMVDGWSTSPRFQQNRADPVSRRFLSDSRHFAALAGARCGPCFGL